MPVKELQTEDDDSKKLSPEQKAQIKKQEKEAERQRKLDKNEKEVSVSESEELQKQGWRVIAVYDKDGIKLHKLIKGEK